MLQLISQILFFLIIPIESLEIALFANNGFQSHDAMMLEIGMEFEGHNITWMQSKIYQFDINPIKLPSEWNKIILQKEERNGSFLKQNILVNF